MRKMSLKDTSFEVKLTSQKLQPLPLSVVLVREILDYERKIATFVSNVT